MCLDYIIDRQFLENVVYSVSAYITTVIESYFAGDTIGFQNLLAIIFLAQQQYDM